ncbi:glycoside hydrolase family 3 [Trichoderma arundinaceum]|uniref:beta-glucosidase n=1 Tax=Trichoderma arundinaceum TaxID=490622 RepID=A0A395NZ76_TRIAR|nr:glycoside hydrolase family 3 [Trichoderma arundinaceum]
MRLHAVFSCCASLFLTAGALALPPSTVMSEGRPQVISKPRGKGNGQWARAYRRAENLVEQMTLEERANITRGYLGDNVCAGNTGSVPRLGWPGMCVHDAGNGVRATDLVNSYPSGIHVGASWDRNLTYRRGFYMGKEFKVKGVNVPLGPNAGPLGRTPLGGRNWEGFSIDPYLSGQLNAETIIGMQEAGVIANIKVFPDCITGGSSSQNADQFGLKHFIANEQETLRRPYSGVEAISANIDDRTLHEYYLWPFMDSVHAGVGSVMCSYNRINNTYGCKNDKLMNGILKTELGFEGFVMLDWNAQHDVFSANAGLDMVMPLGGSWGKNLTDAVANGTISESRIDARDHASQPVILDGAIAGHVLVKNEKGALPFKRKLTMISVFGYDATIPRTKNTDLLFQLGYTSSPEMGQAVLGQEAHFDQAAKGGTIVTGGRAGANSPAYVDDPLSAIQYRARTDGTWVNWDLDSSNPDVNAASDACLVFINAIATEGWDREGLHDDFSDNLVLNVASKCSNTIVVIHAAGTRLVDRWIEHPNITATIIAHLPGQDSGRALVKLLYGEANFSGKLPYTIAKNESDYSVYAPCKRSSANDINPQCDFTEGVYLDYRAFDAKGISPRFEFGYGLSYTSFKYSSLSIKPSHYLRPSRCSGDDLWQPAAKIAATITNIGSVSGHEVAQFYMAIPNSPPKQLRGFDKVFLSPKRSEIVHFELTKRDFSIWDVVSQSWVIQEGEYKLFVGASSRDIRLVGTLRVPINY